MLSRLHALAHEIRLDLQALWLRHRERSALRHLGREVAREGAGGGVALARLMTEIAEGERRCAALATERRASLEADRADLRIVASWVMPAVILRGVCSRLVLRHRETLEYRALRPRFEQLGDLALVAPVRDFPSRTTREVVTVRAELAATAAERERWVAPFGGRVLPPWMAQAASEAAGFGQAFLTQLRSHLLPRVPALAGLAVGWWIANTYTDSHLRSVLRSVGIGQGGTRVVSSSTYETMRFWLPLLAAALCAYLGDRLNEYYGRKGRRPAAEPLMERESTDR